MSTRTIPLPIALLLLADVAVVALYPLSLATLDWQRGGILWKLATLTDLTGEHPLLAWCLSAQLFLIALLLAVLACDRMSRRPASWLLPLPALLAALLSFEAVANVRGWLAFKVGHLPAAPLSSNVFYARDLLAGGLLLASAAAVVAALRVPRWLTRSHPVLRKAAAGALLIALAVTVHWSGAGARVLAVSARALGELLGVTILVWATDDLLRARGLSLLARCATVSRSPAGSPGARPAAAPARSG
jgi:hypothetical protein